MVDLPGARRDEPTHDHVLLEPAQRIAQTPNRRLGQHPGRLLEGGRRDERIRGQGRLGDSKQDRIEARRRLAVTLQPFVLLQHPGTLGPLPLEETALARIGHLHLAQHLPDHDLDMLVIDPHTLEAVDVLDLLDEVGRQRGHPQQAQNIVRVVLPVGNGFALLHVLALEDGDVPPLRDQLLVLGTFVVGDDQSLTPLRILAEAHGPGGLGEDRRLLGLTSLEQVGHPGQTSGDIAGLARLLRNTGDDVADTHPGAVIDAGDGTRRQIVLGRLVRAGDAHIVAVLVQQADHRTQVFAHRTPLFGIHDHHGTQAGHLVDLTQHGNPLDEVRVAQASGHFGHHRMRVRVPIRHDLALFHGLAVLHGEDRTVGYLVALAFASHLVHDRQFARTGDGDIVSGLLVLDQLDVAQLHRPVGLDLHAVDRNRPGRGTPDVEGPHRKLGARLTDTLGGNDPHRLAEVYPMPARQVAAITGRADPMTGRAGDRRADHDPVDSHLIELRHPVLVEQRADRYEHLVGARLGDFTRHGASEDPIAERLHHVTALHQRRHQQARGSAAIEFRHHQVLRNVDQPTGEIARVRRLERSIRETLACTVGGDEILQHVQPFPEIGRDRRLDDRPVRLGHQPAHAGELADLLGAAARPGVRHHEDRIERLLLDHVPPGVFHLVGTQLIHHRLGDHVVGMRPDVHNLVVTLAAGHQPGCILGLDVLDLGFGPGQDFEFLIRDHHILHTERCARPGRVVEPRIHELIGEYDRLLQPHIAVGEVDETGDRLLVHVPVDQIEGHPLGKNLREQGAAHGGIHDPAHFAPISVLPLHDLADPHLDLRMQTDHTAFVGAMHLGHIGEHHALAEDVDGLAGHVIQAEHHVLGRNDDWLAVRRRQDVVGGHHQHPRLDLRLQRQRHMNRHLIAVEVGIERRAHEGMQLDRLAFDQHRLEGLDTETVQRRGPVQHHRMFPDHPLEDVPDLGDLTLHHLLRGLDGRGQTAELELPEDEGFKQLQRHLLGKSALMQTQGGAHHDHRAPGIVDALAQQVLAEAPLLALDHVRKRFEGALVGPGDRPTATPVVQEGIHRFLQHALLVADDDVGRVQLEQALETIVTVDDPPVQIIQIRGREPAAVERHERAQVGRQYREDGEDHPLRAVAGVQERLDQLEALGQALELRIRRRAHDLVVQPGGLRAQVQGLEQPVDRLGAHACVELVPVLLDGLQVLLVGQQLAALELGHPGIDHDEGLEIEHPLDITQGHIQKQPDPGRQRFQEPDMGDRTRQFDMPHVLAAHLRDRHFDAALLADHTTVLEPLVPAAQALIILDGPEDLGAEQSVTLRFERAVVDGLWLLDLSIGPGVDHIGRGQTDADDIEVLDLPLLFEKIQ